MFVSYGSVPTTVASHERAASTTYGASVVVWNDTPVDVEVHADSVTLAVVRVIGTLTTGAPLTGAWDGQQPAPLAYLQG